MTAQGIEAATADKTRSGLTEGESPVRQDAPNPLYQEGYSMTDNTDRLASVSSASAETLALQAIKAVTATAKDGAASLSRIMAIANAAGVRASYSDLLQDPAVALIVDRPRTEWAHLFKPDATGCAIPPEGWQCSRARGHAGPCAASPEPVPATNQAGEVALREAQDARRSGRRVKVRSSHLNDSLVRSAFDAGHKAGSQFAHNPESPIVARSGKKAWVAFSAALATQPATSQEPDGWLAVKVNSEGGIVMPYGPLHPHPDRPNDPRYQWAPFYLGEPK